MPSTAARKRGAQPWGRLRDRMLVSAGGRPAEKPTPDPAVLIDYIDKLTRSYVAYPKWVELREEARGYIGMRETSL